MDYYNGSDFNTAGSSSEAWGAGVLQKVDSINTEFYLTYHTHSFEEVATTYQDQSSWLIGARVRF